MARRHYTLVVVVALLVASFAASAAANKNAPKNCPRGATGPRGPTGPAGASSNGTASLANVTFFNTIVDTLLQVEVGETVGSVQACATAPPLLQPRVLGSVRAISAGYRSDPISGTVCQVYAQQTFCNYACINTTNETTRVNLYCTCGFLLGPTPST